MDVGVIIFATIVVVIFYKVATKHFKFWEKAGIKCVNKPTIHGAFEGTFLDVTAKNVYHSYPGEPYVGIIKISGLTMIARDPNFIRLVLSKDFNFFHDRGTPNSEKRNPLLGHLFHIEGTRWKILRAKLSPTFTSGKLRGMFPLIQICVDQMASILERQSDKTEAVDINEIMSRCTADVILSCAFGLQGNSLSDTNDIYQRMVKKNFESNLTRRLEFIMFTMFPSLQNIVPLSKRQRTVNEFFLNLFRKSVEAREKSGIKRDDYLDLLIEIKKTRYLTGGHMDEDVSETSLEFTDTMMAAQSFVFFNAGSETSSSTASFAIIELANNPDVQEKLRKEVDESIRRHGSLTYESIVEMVYLDQVVSETLRRYPSFVTLMRKVTRPYPMPERQVTLPVGLRVLVPVGHIHHDPQHYPEPKRFDPERFTPEAKRKRHKYVYLPFGEGPRLCIGMRFALVQVKLTLATIISKFELRPKPGSSYPPEVSKNSVVTALAHGAPVLVCKRTRY